MDQRTHKSITAVLNLVVALGSFEGLIAILNLNQPEIFLRTAFIVGLFYILQIILLYDLHYKNRGSLARARELHKSVANEVVKSCKILGSAIWGRCEHLRDWKFVKLWLNYLLLPGMIFWASIALFFVNFGFPKMQQVIVGLSTAALWLNYRYLKEIFARGKELVDKDIFVALSVVKIYAGAIVYMACLTLVKRYCLNASFLSLAVFSLTFLLVYQALFQHKLVTLKNLGVALAMGFIMSVLAHGTLVFWGYNYFTAGIFLASAYNLMWGIFHYHLDHALSWQAFWEIFVICLIVAGMVVGVTNFKARILDACSYSFGVFGSR